MSDESRRAVRAVGRQLRRLAESLSASRRSDRDLLHDFAQRRDEAAFAEIVRRYDRLVFGVCRRLLASEEDARDAFQATFLVLAKRAGKIGWRETIGNWLYSAAYRISLKARARAAARMRVERSVLPKDANESRSDPTLGELRIVLDEELARLPNEYRAPLVLCCLEGLTQDEAAARLGWSLGSVRGRVHRGREMLRHRLERRGILLGTGLSAAFFAQSLAAGSVPEHLVAAVILSGPRFLAGEPLAETVVSNVLPLAQGELFAMFLLKLQMFGALFFAVVVGLASAIAVPGDGPNGGFADHRPVDSLVAEPVMPGDDDEKPKEEKKELPRHYGLLKAVDMNAKTVTIYHEVNDEGRDVVYTMNDIKPTFGTKPVSLGDLKPGMEVVFTTREEKAELVSADFAWPELRAEVKEIDAINRNLSIALQVQNGQTFDVVVKVAPDAKMSVDDFPCSLDDVKVGSEVALRLTIDKKVAYEVVRKSGSDEFTAIFAGLGEGKDTIKLQLLIQGGRHERKIDIGFAVAPTAELRMAGRNLKLSDLKAGMPVLVKLAADARTITNLLADEPRPLED